MRAADAKTQQSCSERSRLGEAVINGVRAELFVCDDIVLARFSTHPDDYEAAHLRSLTVTSNVFLLVAFRLYLDRQATAAPASLQREPRSLQS